MFIDVQLFRVKPCESPVRSKVCSNAAVFSSDAEGTDGVGAACRWRRRSRSA